MTWVQMEALRRGGAGGGPPRMLVTPKKIFSHVLEAETDQFESPAEASSDQGGGSLLKQLEVVVANANMKFASLEDTMSVLTKELSHIKKGTGRRVKIKATEVDDMEEIVRLHSLSGQEKMSGGRRASGRKQEVGNHLRQASAWFPTIGESSDLDESDPEEDEDEAGSAGPASAARQPRRPGSSSDDLQSRVNLEILKLLMKKNERGSMGSASVDGLDEQDDVFDVKGLKGVAALRRRFHNGPRLIFKEYRATTKRLLGVSDPRQVWHFRDISRERLRVFGRMRGFWRCHSGLQEIIQLLSGGDSDKALAYACQLSKALHQVALDKGARDSAVLLLPEPDMLGEPAFGRSRGRSTSWLPFRATGKPPGSTRRGRPSDRRRRRRRRLGGQRREGEVQEEPSSR